MQFFENAKSLFGDAFTTSGIDGELSLAFLIIVVVLIIIVTPLAGLISGAIAKATQGMDDGSGSSSSASSSPCSGGSSGGWGSGSINPTVNNSTGTIALQGSNFAANANAYSGGLSGFTQGMAAPTFRGAGTISPGSNSISAIRLAGLAMGN